MHNNTDLYHLLIQDNQLSSDSLASFQHLSSAALWDTLIANNYFNEIDLQQLYSTAKDTQCLDLIDINIDTSLSRLLKNIKLKTNIIPLYQENNDLFIGVANPYSKIPESLHSNYAIIKRLIPSAQIEDYYTTDTIQKIDYDYIFSTALNEEASDIHCFQRQKKMDIFFRIHGQLQYKYSLANNDMMIFIQQLKLQAHLDLSKSKHPQDGHVLINKNTTQIDARVSTLPTIFGEDIVIRLFNHTFKYRSFNDLSIPNDIQQHLNKMLLMKNGLILITGPTGSGKTTTLYSMLMQLRQQQRGVIVTLEDPVEMLIDGIRQSSINTNIGFDFSTGLKSILRQDPDVIMIGEIRDAQTAKIALDAAYTGHLVLSTLHTADVKSSLLRLHSLGLDPFLINHCLKGIISQKLVIPSAANKIKRQLLQESLLITTKSNILNNTDPLACYSAGELIPF